MKKRFIFLSILLCLFSCQFALAQETSTPTPAWTPWPGLYLMRSDFNPGVTYRLNQFVQQYNLTPPPTRTPTPGPLTPSPTPTMTPTQIIMYKMMRGSIGYGDIAIGNAPVHGVMYYIDPLIGSFYSHEAGGYENPVDAVPTYISHAQYEDAIELIIFTPTPAPTFTPPPSTWTARPTITPQPPTPTLIPTAQYLGAKCSKEIKCEDVLNDDIIYYSLVADSFLVAQIDTLLDPTFTPRPTPAPTFTPAPTPPPTFTPRPTPYPAWTPEQPEYSPMPNHYAMADGVFPGFPDSITFWGRNRTNGQSLLINDYRTTITLQFQFIVTGIQVYLWSAAGVGYYHSVTLRVDGSNSELVATCSDTALAASDTCAYGAVIVDPGETLDILYNRTGSVSTDIHCLVHGFWVIE